MNPSDLIIPLLLAGAAACGTGRRVNVYAALTRGAEDGLTVLLHVIPALVGLLTAVSMFRASGAMDALARLCAPVLNLLGIPAETVPLMLVRPVSGSGALAVASDLMASHGPDSYIGRVAAVMLGSTETTFYTIAVYFSAAGVTRTRYAVPAALSAENVGSAKYAPNSFVNLWRIIELDITPPAKTSGRLPYFPSIFFVIFSRAADTESRQ